MRFSEYYRTCDIPKPEKAEKVKAREDRREARVIKHVRAECVDRDGYCRFQSEDPDLIAIVGLCRGPSQWAHLEEHRRGRTMGQPPEQRHDPRYSAMFCDIHHDAYDAFKWRVEYLTARGANGPLRIYTETQEYCEKAA